MVRITKGMVDRSRPKARPYEIRSEHGLILRIQPSGRKTYYCEYVRHKRKRIGDATVTTLARAQYRAREIMNEEHDHGIILNADPAKATLGGFVERVYTPWLQANRRRADKT